MKQASPYTRLEVAVQAPGVDLITKSSTGPFVDTGYNITFMDGKLGHRLYLSVATIRELAEIAGLIDKKGNRVSHSRGRARRGDSADVIHTGDNPVESADNTVEGAGEGAEQGTGPGGEQGRSSIPGDSGNGAGALDL